MTHYGIWIKQDGEEGFMMFESTEQVFWTTNKHVAEIQLGVVKSVNPEAEIRQFREDSLEMEITLSDSDIVKSIIKECKSPQLSNLSKNPAN